MQKTLCALILILTLSCDGQTNDEMMNGVSFVATSYEIDQSAITPLVELGANWASVIPYGFLRSLETPTIRYNEERQWWGERVDGTIGTIRLMHKDGIDVMLKPQIWIWHGEYTGNVTMTSEENWRKLEDTYEAFILTFAQIAQDENVKLFCIGTEWHKFIENRPEFWNQLITKIKEIYTGALTYAANWDEYKRIHFWDRLDYIGIDAYFPLSDHQVPTLVTLQDAWTPWINEINQVVIAHENKPVLFTEWGYISTDHAAREPWQNLGEEYEVNQELQADLYRAAFSTVMKQPWYKGGFVWKYHEEYKDTLRTRRFTPQMKLALEVLRENCISEQ